jgi:hypothetical protein
LRVACSIGGIDDTTDLGLGLRMTQEGDGIWLPMDAETPFIFTQVGEGRHTILGLVYLYRAMEGEAVKGLTKTDFDLTYLC